MCLREGKWESKGGEWGRWLGFELENLGNLPRATIASWRSGLLQSMFDPENLSSTSVSLIRIFVASVLHSFGGGDRVTSGIY